jgi:hypothetical protein
MKNSRRSASAQLKLVHVDVSQAQRRTRQVQADRIAAIQQDRPAIGDDILTITGGQQRGAPANSLVGEIGIVCRCSLTRCSRQNWQEMIRDIFTLQRPHSSTST